MYCLNLAVKSFFKNCIILYCNDPISQFSSILMLYVNIFLRDLFHLLYYSVSKAIWITFIFVFIDIFSTCCERDVFWFSYSFLLIQYLVSISLIFRSMETDIFSSALGISILLLSLTAFSNQILSLTESFLSFMPKCWVCLPCITQWQFIRTP